MVRNNDSIQTVVGGKNGITSVQNTLHDEGTAPVAADPFEMVLR